MTQTTSPTLTQMDELHTEIDRMTRERRVGSARFDRARWTMLMDELHGRALATDLLRSRVLEDDDRLLGVLLEQPDALNAYLSARAIRNELHGRALKINPRPTVVCATKCGLTGTTECPTDNDETWSCPTC